MSAVSYTAAMPDQARALFKAFEANASIMRKGLPSFIERGEVEEVLRNARNEYGALVPGIPFLGERNLFMKHILLASQGLALSRCLEGREVSVERIGWILCKMVELRVYRMPWITRRIARRGKCSKMMSQ